MIKSRRPEPLFVSAEALFELEWELSEPLFQGVPIGSTLGDIYVTELFLGNHDWGQVSAIMDRLHYRYHWWRGCRTETAPASLEAGRFLLTWLCERQHLRDMVLPLLPALGPEECNIIGRAAAMKAQLPPGAGFLTWEAASRIDMGLWRREYRRCWGPWRRKLKDWCRRHEMPRVIIPHLADAVLTQSQRVMAYGQLLDRLKPRAVITESDRNLRTSCLILTAKVRAIPTMTMIHGVINTPFGYTPLLADIAFCWGRRDYQKMLEGGTAPERLAITGCHRLSRHLNAISAAARSKVGLPLDKPLALLATDPIYPEYRRKLARVFCEGLVGNDRVLAAVRLHPSEKLDFYAQEIAAYPEVRFMSNEEWTLDEALSAADVVVSHNSGFGIDALIKGKLTVILDVLPLPLLIGEELIDRAGCPQARSAGELNNLITRIITFPQFHRKLQKQAEQYVIDSYAAFDEEALANLAKLIMERSTRQGNCPDKKSLYARSGKRMSRGN